MPKGSVATSISERSETLRVTRGLKMARSAQAYVRGSTRQFYEWLDASPEKVPQGPLIWICGDCHLGNLGPLADVRGDVDVQIRDLDQTVIGNPAHDIIRLALSLASAARGSNLPGVATARMLEHLMHGYRSGLEEDPDGLGDEPGQPKLIRKLLERSIKRRWPQLAQDRFTDSRSGITLGKRFWPIASAERDALAALIETADARDLLTRLKTLGERNKSDDDVALVDAAYWMKGCSSLGRLRYAVLVRIGLDNPSMALVDVKEAIAAAAPRGPGAEMPEGDAARVVAGARALSPHLGDRMVVGDIEGREVVLRELAPQDLKIEMKRTKPARAIALACYLGSVVGRAHGRQLGHVDRASWSEITKGPSSSALDAPSWLWSSVVELLGLHEAAYLDHCRLYALDHGD